VVEHVPAVVVEAGNAHLMLLLAPELTAKVLFEAPPKLSPADSSLMMLVTKNDRVVLVFGSVTDFAPPKRDQCTIGLRTLMGLPAVS
jgi:hypothetical protein